ncbi:MAG: hypothetical protein IJX96_04445 [Clostridia bacterium]|nr:hypothetical protein [Clostridia bacterium]
MTETTNGEKLSQALLKVALGYKVAEVTEEFAEVDGELKLTKRKRTKKDVPPDLKAVQILLGESGGAVGLEKMTDEQLEEEKKRLLAALEESKTTEKKIASPTARNDKGDKGAVKKPRPKPRKRVVRNKKEV